MSAVVALSTEPDLPTNQCLHIYTQPNSEVQTKSPRLFRIQCHRVSKPLNLLECQLQPLTVNKADHNSTSNGCSL